MPELRAPEDRLAPVEMAARRQRRTVAVIAAAALTGVVLLAGVACMRGRPVAPAPVTAGSGTAQPSATRTDGVLETAGCASYSAAPTTQIQGTPQVGNSNIINELNNRLVPYATAHFGDVFALTQVRADVGRLRAYRKPSSSFDAWVRQEFEHDCVEVADAQASARDMQTRADKVSNDHRYWVSRGIDVLSVGGNPIDGIVEVGVSQKSLAKARQEMPQRYPDLRIRVVASGIVAQ